MDRRFKTVGELLDEGFPNIPGTFSTTDVRELARRVGVSFQAVYKWRLNNRIAPKWLTKLVEVSEGNLSRDDILPFCIPE